MEEEIKLLEELIYRYCELEEIESKSVWLEVTKEQERAIENLINRNKELKNSLIDMVNQFAYEDNNPKTKGSSLEKLYTGGLSALENAFNTLNIDEGIEREQLWKLSE